MSTELTCTVCGAVNAFGEEHAGRMGKCGQCQTPLYVPRREEMPPASISRVTGANAGGVNKGLLAAGILGVLVAIAAAGYFLLLPGDKPADANEAKTKEKKEEPKDPFTIPQAVTLTSSAAMSQEGKLETAKSENVYKFKAPSAGTLAVYFDALEGSKLEGQLIAFDAQRKEIIKNEADADKRASQILFPVDADKEYYVKVAGFDGAGKYKATFSHITDVPATFENALEVRLTKTGAASQSWNIKTSSDEDMFRVVATVSGWMAAEVKTGAVRLDAKLFAYEASRDALSQDNFTQDNDGTRRLRFYVEAGKTYYVKIGSWASPLSGMTSTGPYTLVLRTDKADKDDHGNYFTSATDVFLKTYETTSVGGRVDSPLDIDYFRIKPVQTGTLKVELLNTPGSNLSASATAYDVSRFAIGQGGGSRYLTISVFAGSTYYVKVMASSFPPAGTQQTGGYTLNFRMETNQFKPVAPVTSDFTTAREVYLGFDGNAKVSEQLKTTASYFRFKATASGPMTVEVKDLLGGSNVAASAYAYDGGYFSIGSGAGSRKVDFSVFSGNTYYIKIVSGFLPVGKTTFYDLVFRANKPPPVKGQEALSFSHTHEVQGVAFSPDGKRLAGSCWNQTVKIWDLTTGLELRTLWGHTGNVHMVAFSPDGKRLASASSDRTVKVWDLSTGQTIFTLNGHTANVWHVAFSPDGKRIASASWDQTVKVWDAATSLETHTLKGHTGTVNAVAFDPTSKRLASSSNDRTVRVWLLGSGTDGNWSQESLNLKAATSVCSVAFSPDGKRIAAASDRTVTVWDATTGTEVFSFKGHTANVESIAFNPDGKYLVSGSGDKLLKVWNLVTGQEALTFYGHTNGVWGVAFSPDGKRVATGSSDRTVRIWNVPQSMHPALKTTTGQNSTTAPFEEKAHWDGVPVKLDLKLNPGDFFYVENIVDQDTKMDILGQLTNTKTKYTRVDRYEIEKIFPQMVLGITMQQLKIKTNPPLEIESILSRAKGARFTMTVEPGKKQLDFQGYEPFVQRLAQGNFTLEDKVRKSIAREALQKGMEGVFVELPQYAVRQGDQWTVTSKLPFGAFGTINVSTVMTYEGTRKGLDVIKSVSTTTLVANVGAAMGPATITQAEFKPRSATGSILFDRKKGRLVSATMPQTLDGSFTLSVAGQTSQMTVLMTQTAICRVWDLPPITKE